mmetsp:Transcript_14650/g.39755  ORF Transcript_14650/g.39755 Transcript_14650/m.39755 type:complete len:205 (-) Transcript_14650:456-1070(-)
MAESKHRIYTSALEAALGAQLESGSKQPIRLDACGIAARQGLAHGPGRGGRCHDHRRARVGGYAWRGWRHTRVCAAKKGERERRREAHATDGVLNFLRLPERATQADDAVGERLAARAHCRSEEVVRIITRSAPESIRMRYLVGLLQLLHCRSDARRRWLAVLELHDGIGRVRRGERVRTTEGECALECTTQGCGCLAYAALGV